VLIIVIVGKLISRRTKFEY